MKIILVIDQLCAGGAQRQLVNMAIEFKKKGYFVSFLVYHDHDFYKSYLSDNGIEVNLIISNSYLSRIWKCWTNLHHSQPDVVISFLEGASFICELSSIFNKKWILIVGERNANPNIGKSFKLRFYRFFHFFADHVVANSMSNIDMVKKVNPFISASKLKVIYNLIQFENWPPSELYLPLKNDKFDLLVLARYHVSKNLIGLINAVRLLTDFEREKLVVNWYGEVGDDTYDVGMVMIKEYNLERIIFLHKETKSVLNLIQKCDCVGLFSFYEGLPNAICEAMSTAKPVMYSDVSDIPKIIANSNYSFDPKNVHEIKDTISYFLSLDRQSLIDIGASNRRVALERFDKDIIIDKYIRLFN